MKIYSVTYKDFDNNIYVKWFSTLDAGKKFAEYGHTDGMVVSHKYDDDIALHILCYYD